MGEYTLEQWDFEIELEKYINQPKLPRFEHTAKLARRFLQIKGENPWDLLQFVTAVKSLEQIYNEAHSPK